MTSSAGAPTCRGPRYPDDLPVVARREEIARAIAENQVVIVCGETGSGKTTQLPKICLELGPRRRGHDRPHAAAADRRAHRRRAHRLGAGESRSATPSATRCASPTGVSADTYIKVMTDGILLAETQGDRLLRAYDTLIIDEAHERSLNIDFLLGYLKELLQGGDERPDLKLIVTSATIDAERFSRHFDMGRPAPVIEVSGRSIRSKCATGRSPAQDEDEEEQDVVDGILDAVDELARLPGGGDMLVFLPGEREIRETAEALRGHASEGRGDPAALRAAVARGAGARISARRRAPHRARDQRRRDLAHRARHPLRGGYRSRARQPLQLPQQGRAAPDRADSQASANQRAGRCGRVAAGVCIRLYSEEDYARAAAVHRPRDPALVARGGDPAHEGAGPDRRRALSRFSIRRRRA